MAENFLYQKENAFQSKSNVDEVSSNNSSEDNPIPKNWQEFHEAERFSIDELKEFWQGKLKFAFGDPDMLNAIIVQMRSKSLLNEYFCDSNESNDKMEHLFEEEIEKFCHDKLGLAGKDTNVLDAIVDELEKMNLQSNRDSLEYDCINSRKDKKIGNELIYSRILKLRAKVKKTDLIHKTFLKFIVDLKDSHTAFKNVFTEAYCQRLTSAFSVYKTMNAEYFANLKGRLEILSQENCDEFNETMRRNDIMEEIAARFFKCMIAYKCAHS